VAQGARGGAIYERASVASASGAAATRGQCATHSQARPWQEASAGRPGREAGAGRRGGPAGQRFVGLGGRRCGEKGGEKEKNYDRRASYWHIP
jgi:hypothetical protein